MSKRTLKPKPTRVGCEILILPDGRLLAHNLTPAMARVLGGMGVGSWKLGAGEEACGSNSHQTSPQRFKSDTH